MANRVSIPIVLAADISGVDGLVKRMATSLTAINEVQKVLREHGKILQARAVRNVSGNVVEFDGKTFIINRQTGKLARSIQVGEPNALAVVVEATAEYAGDVELGTRGPVDLKLTKLAGKVIPLPISSAQTKAITGKNGQNIKTIFVGRFSSKQTTTSGFGMNYKLTTTGKTAGMQGFLFRRVPGPSGKGWIIPQRPPRPFMAEAADYTLPLLTEAIETTFAKYLEGGDQP